MSSTTAKKINDCWNRIGVWGKEQPRCGILDQVIHCHNCNVYVSAGRELLSRDIPVGYEQEWYEIYAREKCPDSKNRQSALVFRLGAEWFALSTPLFEEVTELKQIHSIPHRNSPVLQGLVNIRGTLLLCISLGTLLGVEKNDKIQVRDRTAKGRLAVIHKNNSRYVFPVSELSHIQHYEPEEVVNAPSAAAQANQSFVSGVLASERKKIALVDTELLFLAIERSLA